MIYIILRCVETLTTLNYYNVKVLFPVKSVRFVCQLIELRALVVSRF